MKVRLAYGKTGLAVDLPDDVTVIRSQQLPGLADEAEALRSAAPANRISATVATCEAWRQRGDRTQRHHTGDAE